MTLKWDEVAEVHTSEIFSPEIYNFIENTWIYREYVDLFWIHKFIKNIVLLKIYKFNKNKAVYSQKNLYIFIKNSCIHQECIT